MSTYLRSHGSRFGTPELFYDVFLATQDVRQSARLTYRASRKKPVAQGGRVLESEHQISIL